MSIGPKLAVSAGVWHEGRVLLVQRAKSPMDGLWTFPGGHVEPGEPAELAVRREVLEETGIEVVVRGEPMLHEIILTDAAGALTAHRVLLVFAAVVAPGSPVTPVAADDAAAAAFFDPAAIAGLATTPRLFHFIDGTASRAGVAAPPP
jgi:ADP-ribose pyrophosphatase YjhB (NUDIX family)